VGRITDPYPSQVRPSLMAAASGRT